MFWRETPTQVSARAQHHTSCELGRRIWKEELEAITPEAIAPRNRWLWQQKFGMGNKIED